MVKAHSPNVIVETTILTMRERIEEQLDNKDFDFLTDHFKGLGFVEIVDQIEKLKIQQKMYLFLQNSESQEKEPKFIFFKSKEKVRNSSDLVQSWQNDFNKKDQEGSEIEGYELSTLTGNSKSG